MTWTDWYMVFIGAMGVAFGAYGAALRVARSCGSGGVAAPARGAGIGGGFVCVVMAGTRETGRPFFISNPSNVHTLRRASLT
jgi:hypothetical protein